MLFVENTLGGDVSIFDEKNDFREVGRVSLGDHIIPDDICCSADGRFLYANGAVKPESLVTGNAAGANDTLARFMADYDGKQVPLLGDQQPHTMSGDSSVLVAFDTATLEEAWRVEIKGHVGHLAITPDDRYVYNSLFDRFFVARVDTVERRVDYIPIPTNGGHGARVSRDGKRVYIGSILMAEMDVIEVESSRLVQRLLFPDNVRPFDLTADGRLAYVQNSRFHGFHVYDLQQEKILRSIALPPLPPGTPVIEAFPHTIDHGLILTEDESHLLALATTGDYVAIYSHPELELLGCVPIGGEPSWLIADRESRFAYCSNRTSDDVSVVDIAARKEVARFHAGSYPQRLWLT